MVELTSSSSDSDDHRYDTVKLLNSKKDLVKLSQILKINRILKEFKNKRLDTHDRNLIRGIFVRKPGKCVDKQASSGLGAAA